MNKNKGFIVVPLLIGLGIIGSVIVGTLGYKFYNSNKLGAVIPVSNALIDTYLSIGINNSVTSMTLANGTTRDGVALSGYNCFTIDANTPTVEYVCGTATGASITGMIRGISMSNPNTTTTPYEHRRFASVQSTDYPQIAIISRILNGTDTVPNLLTYDNKVLITNASASTTIATKYYVDNVIIAGAPDANTTTKGIVQIATALQVASSTVLGSTGANLAIPASNATSTYNSATSPLKVVVTDNSGKIDGNFIDGSDTYTFSGNNTLSGNNLFSGLNNFTSTTTVKGFSASSTVANPMILNSLSYSMPASHNASSTVLMNNGSGSLTWLAENPEVLLNDGTTYSSTGASTTVTLAIPAGKMGATDSLEISMFATRVSTAIHNSADILIGTGSATTTLISASGNKSSYDYKIKLWNNSSSVQNFFTDKIIASTETHTNGTGTLNTSNKFYISFSVATGGGGDELIIKGLRVLLYKK